MVPTIIFVKTTHTVGECSDETRADAQQRPGATKTITARDARGDPADEQTTVARRHRRGADDGG